MNLEPITPDEYSAAVVQLFEVASHSGSGARAAAQVLLSTYNGEQWQMDLTDLCCFDNDNYRAALTVMRGRRELMCEPQRVIKDGDKHFEKIWEQWKRYHISNRYKLTCYDCNGSGKVLEDEYNEDSDYITCPRCNGGGLLEPEGK